jgi:hypothetical protein
MKKIIDIKYTIIGLSIAGIVGYIISLVSGISFWAAFIIVAVAMFLNGLVAEYEDNLPNGFNNPMSEEQIRIENIKRKRKLLPIRILTWIVFASIVGLFVWAYVNKSV